MKRKWRFKVSEAACYNYWCTFELTAEGRQILTDMGATVYPMVDLIIFKNREDIIIFGLKGGFHDLE